MSRQYASQLQFEVYPSRVYQLIILIITVTAFIAVYLIGYIIPIISLILLAILLFLVINAYKNNCYRKLIWQADGTWLIEQNNNQFVATLCEGSVVTSFFAVLNFNLQNRKKLNLILFKDNIDKEAFRRLRVKIKVEGI